MSNIPEEVENDPTYRRKMLYAWSTMLKDRDDILQELNKELENVDVLRYDRPKIDGLLSRLEERDRILVSSRYMRVLSNATLLDRAIVGVQSFFALRLVSFSQMMLPVVGSMIGIIAAYYGLRKVWPDVMKWLSQSHFVTPAYAASEPINPESAKLIMFGGFGLVLAIVFVWFAIVATLSKNTQTRKAAMDFVKSGLTFFGGIVTGVFAKPF